MNIKKLPLEVRCKLESGAVITDAVQCVLEMVYNSIDAEASGIAVRINLKTYQIQVIDNGRGIARDDLEFVGERYMTSKNYDFEKQAANHTYGFKGQALSSIIDVSHTVTIETKTALNETTFVKVFKAGKGFPVTASKHPRHSIGTTVIVSDFMHMMPVRRKRINEVFHFEEIKNQMQYLAIIHYNVCFTLRNENKGVILLQTFQASSMLESVKNIYGKSLAKGLKALNFQEKKYEISGFISIKPETNNTVQLLFVNKRVITKGVFHRFINNLMKKYNKKKEDVPYSSDSKTEMNLNNKCLNSFLIQLKCHYACYELFTTVRETTVEFKDWRGVLKCLHKAIRGLYKNTFNWNSSANSLLTSDQYNSRKIEGKRKKFSTSLLINAVKGPQVTRKVRSKRSLKKKKKKKTNNIENHSLVKCSDIEPAQECLNLCSQSFVNCTLESPIPKGNCNNFVKLDSKAKEGTSHLFLEFYDWIKETLTADVSAFNLYNKFIENRKKTDYLSEGTNHKSPVLGRKLKKRKVSRIKKLESQINVEPEKEISVTTKEELTLYHSGHMHMEEAVKFTTLKHKLLNENNLTLLRRKNLDNTNNMLCNDKNNIILYNQNQSKLSMVSSSEVQFTNVMKFRNMPETLLQHQSDLQDNICLPFTSYIDSTWVSHYKDFSNQKLNMFKKRCRTDSNSTLLNVHEGVAQEKNRKKIQKQQPLPDLHYLWLNDFEKIINAKQNKQKNAPRNSSYKVDLNTYYKERRMKDVAVGTSDNFKQKSAEVQVNIPGKIASFCKNHVCVQTSPFFPKSSSKLYSPVLKIESAVQTSDLILNSPDVLNICSFIANDVSCNQEILNTSHSSDFDKNEFEAPSPDFCNTSTHLKQDEIDSMNVNKDEPKGKQNVDGNTFEDISSSKEYLCRHKSLSESKKLRKSDSSKETQTLAAIWTDSLTHIDFSIENSSEKIKVTNTHDAEIPDIKSNDTGVPATIPLEDITCNNALEATDDFCLSERFIFVPKGLSPTFLNTCLPSVSVLKPCEKSEVKSAVDNALNDTLGTVKWQDELTGNCIKPVADKGTFSDLQKKTSGLMNLRNQVLSASMSYCAVKVHNLLYSFAFTKELLSSAEVIGQLDKKFIVTKIKLFTPKKMELIAAFDQHAVDERIKLEELVNENISSDGKFKSTSLRNPVICALSESHSRLVTDLKGKLLNYGFKIESRDMKSVAISEVPSFLLCKYKKDIENNKETSFSEMMEIVLVNIMNEISETRGAATKTPKFMHQAFCLQACHKAIKFNKELSVAEMSDMILKLQKCKLPFQCAHGRPSVIPIIDLEDFNLTVDENKCDIQSFKKFMK